MNLFENSTLYNLFYESLTYPVFYINLIFFFLFMCPIDSFFYYISKSYDDLREIRQEEKRIKEINAL